MQTLKLYADILREFLICAWAKSQILVKIKFSRIIVKLQYHSVNPSHAVIRIMVNATAAGFVYKKEFPIPVQVKEIIKNKICNIWQIYL